MNTGRAPQWTIASAVATKLFGTVITSSPAPTPDAKRARCSAAVPLHTPRQYFSSLERCEGVLECLYLRPQDKFPMVDDFTRCIEEFGFQSFVLTAEVHERDRHPISRNVEFLWLAPTVIPRQTH